MKTVFIYALCEPGTRTIRYLGKSVNPEWRIKEHYEPFRLRNNHLGCWLRSLHNRPSLVVLKEVSEIGWQEWEQRYIRCARALGFDLVNGTDGGDGVNGGEKHPNFGKHLSPETRAKIGAAHAGKKISESSKVLMSEAKRGRKLSLKTREKMRGRVPWNKGKPSGIVPWNKGKSSPVAGENHYAFGTTQSFETVQRSRITRCFNRVLKICQPIE